MGALFGGAAVGAGIRNLPVFAVPIAAAASGCAVVAWNSRATVDRELLLSPTGTRQRGGRFSFDVSWADLAAVLPWERAAPFGQRRQLYLVGRGGSPIDLRCDLIEIDDVVPYWLLRFYHSGPAARSELGTQASLEQIRRLTLTG